MEYDPDFTPSVAVQETGYDSDFTPLSPSSEKYDPDFMPSQVTTPKGSGLLGGLDAKIGAKKLRPSGHKGAFGRHVAEAALPSAAGIGAMGASMPLAVALAPVRLVSSLLL